MPASTDPLYLDWQFWSVLIAALAIVLSQLPPVHLLLRPKRLEVEVHSRIQIAHKVGNPNVGMFVSVRNTGGRDLRIRSLQTSVSRDGVSIGVFPAQNYYETPSSKTSVLFIPFSLKPGEAWDHGTNFLTWFDRSTEKLFREGQAALIKDIRNKINARAKDSDQPVIADPELIKPFLELFNRLFIWTPGEYVVNLEVLAEPKSASFSKKYRFTLYESDSTELKSHIEDYKFGGGISYEVDHHVAILAPITSHEA